MEEDKYLEYLSKMIEQTHDPLYMVSLALLYHYGANVERYPEEASYWFTQAAITYREQLAHAN